jgi:hypothetical protein
MSVSKGARSRRREDSYDEISDLMSAQEGLISQASGYKSSLNHYSMLQPSKNAKKAEKHKLSVDDAAKNAIKFVSSNKKYLESAAKRFNKNNSKHSRQMSDIFFVTSDSNSQSPITHNRSTSSNFKAPSISIISHPSKQGLTKQ